MEGVTSSPLGEEGEGSGTGCRSRLSLHMAAAGHAWAKTCMPSTASGSRFTARMHHGAAPRVCSGAATFAFAAVECGGLARPYRALRGAACGGD